ncbi:hypothetical protein F4779DRAFT_154965 [Xylariaceae sp. FL0662B]|nr:hypothetical protein F4779DRAFT_154965 [Xylariaceae sp. FL0662B]
MRFPSLSVCACVCPTTLTHSLTHSLPTSAGLIDKARDSGRHTAGSAAALSKDRPRCDATQYLPPAKIPSRECPWRYKDRRRTMYSA